MFSLEDEDEDDFITKPEISSKLANLFESNEIKLDVEASNRSLIYTPPKQPKKFELNSSSSGDNANNANAMTLINASAVNVFKFENEKYKSRGKLGAALLANHDTRTYKLILYTGKQQHITYASISDSFKLICQPNTYCSFYDDNRQNWSLMFDTEEEKCNFSRQLTVCKFNTISKSGNDCAILTQDLILGNENSPIVAEDNDSIELRYKGWMFEESQTVGKLFVNIDGNSKKPFRIKLIGRWAEMLRGMRIGSKRFIIIDQSLKDELKEIMENVVIDQSSKCGFDFELMKIQTRVQQKKTKQKSESKEQIEIKEQKNSVNETEKEINSGKKSHSSSISDSIKEENPSNKPKSDILSRMSRMGGLPILPIKPEPIVNKSETIDTTDAEEENHPKPFPKPRNSSLTENNSQSTENLIVTNNSNIKIPENNSISQNFNQIPVTSMATPSYQTTIPAYFMPQTIETNLSVLTSETRSNNTEIRMNLNKILDKIDSVSEKVTEIKNSSTPSMNSLQISSIGFMDSAIIMSSIQRIVNENNSLKKEVDEKTSSLQKLNEKICDLLQQTNSNHQNTQELDKLLMSESRLKRELVILNEDCDRFRTKNDELISENSRLKQTVNELKSEIENRSNGAQKTKEFSNQVKKLMNDMFRKFNAQIDENKSYNSEEIIEIVSNSIRSATLSIIDSQNNSRTNSPFRQSFDEIDKNKQNIKVDENIKKTVEKPAIPQRKSIETQQNTDKTVNDSENTKPIQKIEETNEENK